MNTLFDFGDEPPPEHGAVEITPKTPRGLCLLHLAPDTWEAIRHWSRDQYAHGTYRHVVGQTGFTRTWRVALVLVSGQVAGGVAVRRFGRPGRGQDGLEIKMAESFSNSVLWDRLAGELPSARKRSLDREDGDALPLVTSGDLETALQRLTPGAIESLNRLFASVRVVDRGSGTAALIREQRDAVALALEIGGFDSRELLDAAPEQSSVPFLVGLKRTRTTEASVLRHEAVAFDGWLKTEADHFDVATFHDPSNDKRRMSIFYADKELLERQTGTDLIYYRHHRPGFILVQYKRMRRSSDSREATYFPDEQLHKELARAKALPSPTAAAHPNEWRLTEDSFFVKLVADDLARPTANKLVYGMYLPGSLVELLLASSERDEIAKGWSAKSLSTYLSNGEFLQLAKQGYLGTRGATTEAVMKLITSAFDEDRGVVIALDETDPSQVDRPRHG